MSRRRLTIHDEAPPSAYLSVKFVGASEISVLLDMSELVLFILYY
jgi:hypothetical protein